MQRFLGDYKLRRVGGSSMLSLGHGLMSLGTANLCGLSLSEISGPDKPQHHLTDVFFLQLLNIFSQVMVQGYPLGNHSFAILSCDPFKILNLKRESKVLRRKEAHLTPKYSQHIVILNFKHSSLFSLPSLVSKVAPK